MEKQTKRKIEWIIFSLLGLAALFSLSLFFYQLAYAGKIYRNVYAAGIDLSGLDKKQASALLNNRYQGLLEEELILKSKSGEIATKVKDTGLSVDLEKTTSESFKIGRDNNFFKSLVKSLETLWKKNEIVVEPSVDKVKYDNFLNIAVAQLNSKPSDATLAIEKGEIKTVAEKNGFQVDTTNLLNKILSITNNTSSHVISLDTKIVPPTIKEGDFVAATQFADAVLSKKLELKYEEKTYSPSRLEIGNWISFSNKEGKYFGSLNEGNLSAYLDKVAKDFEVTKKDKRINALDNSVIEEGREGKYLDKKDAIAQIKNGINGSAIALTVTMKTYTTPPGEVKVFPAEGLVPGRFQGKYIDIDLTLQKLCRIESTTIIDCFIISSGRPGMATPTGTYAISEKNPRYWSSTYSMWLPYWQRFKTGGYGIHELPETATWKEVPDHLGTPVSHGCVRLGVGPAETVFNWTEIGTPVYIHK